MNYTFFPLSEDAILVQFGSHHDQIKQQIVDVQIAIEKIYQTPFVGFKEIVPAYHTITIYYDPFVINTTSPYQSVIHHLDQVLRSSHTSTVRKTRRFDIPVCYSGDFGLDLFELSTSTNKTIDEIIQLHTNVVYDVIFIGFAPGFPFLHGLPKELHYPRKMNPRLKVDRGSVGIAGTQTGIYPLDSPGGWQILGRTPVSLFDVNCPSPTRFRAGDKVKFYPISLEQFHNWEDQPWE
jgi:inhibitor of KinA